MEPISTIRTWAASRSLPLQENVVEDGVVKLLVLNGEAIPGEMSIVGEITVRRVGESPASFAIETCRGRMILDESWAGEDSLPGILDSGLQLLQRRVASPLAQWALASVEVSS